MFSVVAQKVQTVLLKHLAPLIAESVFASALQETAYRPERLGYNDLAILLPKLERKIRLFVPAAGQAQALSDLRALVVSHAPTTRVIDVRTETDISVARVQAKGLCE